MDLSNLSRNELVKLRADIDKALIAAEERDRREALKAAEKAAAEFGFSLKDLGAAPERAPAKRASSVAKYRNPNNPDETWTGRGRKPGWIYDALKQGIDLAKYEI